MDPCGTPDVTGTNSDETPSSRGDWGTLRHGAP